MSYHKIIISVLNIVKKEKEAFVILVASFSFLYIIIFII